MRYHLPTHHPITRDNALSVYFSLQVWDGLILASILGPAFLRCLYFASLQEGEIKSCASASVPTRNQSNAKPAHILTDICAWTP